MSYRRIACLSTEAVETLYLLGAEDCIAGILSPGPGELTEGLPQMERIIARWAQAGRR